MKRFSGFTLSELMIAITVLGILCATVLPAVLGNNPNQNKMMMKKAYYTFAEVINELINDPEYYPSMDGICPINKEPGYLGFDCNNGASQLPYLFLKSVNTSEKIIGNQSIMANTKFSKNTNKECAGVKSPCYFIETSDSIRWLFSQANDFTKGDATKYTTIGIDINGDKKPNCFQGSTDNACKNRTKNFDQFRIRLYADGKMEIDPADVWAGEAIQVSSALSED